MDLTPEALSQAKFRGPVRFYDGSNGWARQEFDCVDEPRFGYAWQRDSRKDKGRQYYTVDGAEVADFAEAARLLALPPDPQSPAQQAKASIDEFKFSPKVGGATRALSEARCNGDAGPFGTVRAWMKRADNSWHQGINALSDQNRKAGEEFPHWLYHAKSAAHESYRAMYLFAADRETDTQLQCALGKRCRDCSILQQIETSMIASRLSRLPSEIDDADIDAAKVWTCIGHVLTIDHTKVCDGMFISTERDRKSTF